MTQRVVAYEVLSSPPDPTVCIQDSTGGYVISSDPIELLTFLRYKQSSVLRVFWDLDESLSHIFRRMPLPVLMSLANFDENCQLGEHQLYYLPARSFRVGRARFYGIREFWPTDYPEPATLSEVQSHAEELLSTLSQCGMPDPIKLTSPIAIFEGTKRGQETYDTVPKGYALPRPVWEALEYAYKADRREWITAYQIGHWSGVDNSELKCYNSVGNGAGNPITNKVSAESGTPSDAIWDYDNSSCYPSIAADLLDIRDMDAWKSSTYGSRERGAYYGVLRGHLYLDPNHPLIHCSPIMTDLERMPGNPAGDFGDDYPITLDEVRFVNRYGMGEFRIESGWFFRPSNGVRPRRPFYDIMHYLYDQRGISPLASSVMKGVANQLIGKLIETKVTGDYGDLRNDLYHAIILAKARVKVAEFLVNNDVANIELVAVQTDGCRLSKYVPVYGSGMGSWRCNGSQPTIVASPYKVYTAGKKPGHLTYDMITEMVQEHPLSSYYGRMVKHRTTLKQALQQGDLTLVGNLDDLPAHIDLNTLQREQNRNFPRLPRTGQSLLSNRYQSSPVVL